MPFDDRGNMGITFAMKTYLHQALKSHLKKVKRTQLKFLGNIEDSLQRMTSTEGFIKILKHSLIDIPKSYIKNTEAAIVIDGENNVIVIRVGKQWYKFNDLSPEQFYKLIEPELRKKIPFMIKRAIIKVKNAIGPLPPNNSIRLAISPKGSLELSISGGL